MQRRVPSATGREASLVGRPDFKSGKGRKPVLGGFDSHSLPPRFSWRPVRERIQPTAHGGVAPRRVSTRPERRHNGRMSDDFEDSIDPA
jgi:hypothetical protein